jgi:hypothetical protein
VKDLFAEGLHGGVALRQIELAKIGFGDENEDTGIAPSRRTAVKLSAA